MPVDLVPLDFHIWPPRSKEVRRAWRDGDRGLYYNGKAHVFLTGIARAVREETGRPEPEHLLVREVITTIIHETLHRSVRDYSSRGRCGRIRREHRAIARLLSWSGWEWT